MQAAVAPLIVNRDPLEIHMHTFKQLIVASATAFVAAGAFAQEATPDAWMKAAADKSRAQVAAEMAQARKDGTIKAVSATYDFVTIVPAVKSRDQVRAEVLAARDSGELAALNGEAQEFRGFRQPVYAKH